ncbi:MAG: hypothetical protein ABSA83_18700 [Verrucomicrobiota bacterium]|jgi:hypothetical protein
MRYKLCPALPALNLFVTPRQPSFRILIAWDEQDALFQAGKVLGLVDTLSGKQIGVSRVFWSFALLRNALLRDFAAKDAAEAELIVLAFSGHGELPPHVKCWVETWPIRLRAGKAALVTLIRSKQESCQQQIDYLRKMAKNRGLEFFHSQVDWRSPDRVPAPFRHAHIGAMSPAHFISDHIPGSTGEFN